MKLSFSDQPIVYDRALKATLACLVLFGFVHWSPDQFAGLVLALESVLGTLVLNKVTTNTKVDAKITTATDARETEIHDYLQASADEEAAKAPVAQRPRKASGATKRS